MNSILLGVVAQRGGSQRRCRYWAIKRWFRFDNRSQLVLRRLRQRLAARHGEGMALVYGICHIQELKFRNSRVCGHS